MMTRDEETTEGIKTRWRMNAGEGSPYVYVCVCVCVGAHTCVCVCVEGVQMEAKYNSFVTGKGSDS